MAKVYMAYIFWFLGGWFGLHHFYLGRDRQAFVWWCLLGAYGGWISDFFKIPRYVKEANNDEGWLAELIGEMKKNPHKPPFSFYRFFGQVAMGNLLAWAVHRGIPEEETLFGYSFSWLHIAIPIASAIGVHTVGNIGREEGSLKNAIYGAMIPYVFYTLEEPHYYWSSVVAALFFRSKVKWNRKLRKPRHVCKRAATLATCGILYLSLWTSYLYFNMSFTNEHGETIKFRESVNNLLKSQLWKQFTDSLKKLWQYYRTHGWLHAWDELMKTLDPMGERNALSVLELSSSSTQEEITKKWREMSRKYHPDKFTDPEEKAKAQEKFIEIKEAYDKISVIHSRRRGKSSRSRSSA